MFCEIRESQIHGKGVFATGDIPKDTQLVCDVLLMSEKSRVLKDYYYPWNLQFNAICIGFGSYFNSSKTPNVKILTTDTKNLTMTFITLRDIEKGEEMVLYYGL